MLLLLACRTPDPVGGSADTAPVDPGRLELVLHEPLQAPAGPEQHHATVALAADGSALVAYVQDELLFGLRLDPDGTPTPVPWSSPVHHPQIRSADDGWWMAATQRNAVALHVVHHDPAGAIDRQAVFPGEPALFPDLVDTGSGVTVVATDNDTLSCRALDASLEPEAPIPCPEPVDPDRSVGTVALDEGPDGAVVVWTEATSDDATSVYLFDGVQTVTVGTSSCQEAATAGPCVGSRPMVLTDAEGHSLVSWRGAETVGGRRLAWLNPVAPDGSVTAPWPVGLDPGAEVDRPALGDRAVDGRTVVAWEEAGAVWLQPREVPSGAPAGDPVAVDDGDPDRDARRPAVTLRATAGGTVGVVTWESAPAGSPAGTSDRTLWMRRFELAY